MFKFKVMRLDEIDVAVCIGRKEKWAKDEFWGMPYLGEEKEPTRRN